MNIKRKYVTKISSSLELTTFCNSLSVSITGRFDFNISATIALII